MVDEQIQQQVQQLKDVRNKIVSLKKELNKLNREKESWFKKRSAFNKQIGELIGDVKGSKQERDKITSEVKEIKDQRDELNQEIAQRVAELKELKDKVGDQPRPDRKEKQVSPSMIKKQIERLDYVMQTEPMSFKKEQQMMAQMKQLKKDLKEASDTGNEWRQITKLQREISKLRKKSNSAHKYMQSNAAESQEKHEDVIGTSKEIDELKEKERESYEKFKEFKDQFQEKNTELKAFLKEADELKLNLEENNVEVEEDKRQVQAAQVKAKAKEVNEKIKTGKKLTTEDLLVFQKANK
jgi:uncharacterized coiled-coil DUF342 family protein